MFKDNDQLYTALNCNEKYKYFEIMFTRTKKSFWHLNVIITNKNV